MLAGDWLMSRRIVQGGRDSNSVGVAACTRSGDTGQGGHTVPLAGAMLMASCQREAKLFTGLDDDPLAPVTLCSCDCAAQTAS